MPENPVNLHEVDRDPRKMIAVRRLVGKYPEAIDYWHKSGIDERTVATDKDGLILGIKSSTNVNPTTSATTTGTPS